MNRLTKRMAMVEILIRPAACPSAGLPVLSAIKHAQPTNIINHNWYQLTVARYGVRNLNSKIALT